MVVRRSGRAVLTRTMPSVRWMFTRWFAVASIALFRLYLGLLGESLAPSSSPRWRRPIRSSNIDARRMSSRCGRSARSSSSIHELGPRLRVQVLRRRGARARLHARLLSAGVLLQRVRCVELSRAARAAVGHGRRRHGFRSSSPASRRSCGGPRRPERLSLKSRWRRCSSAA